MEKRQITASEANDEIKKLADESGVLYVQGYYREQTGELLRMASGLKVISRYYKTSDQVRIMAKMAEGMGEKIEHVYIGELGQPPALSLTVYIEHRPTDVVLGCVPGHAIKKSLKRMVRRRFQMRKGPAPRASMLSEPEPPRADGLPSAKNPGEDFSVKIGSVGAFVFSKAWLCALNSYAGEHLPDWKSKLRADWKEGTAPELLQAIYNEHGSEWLADVHG